eukprot:356925-Chlamydomonas_euryale.AAC.1
MNGCLAAFFGGCLDTSRGSVFVTSVTSLERCFISLPGAARDVSLAAALFASSAGAADRGPLTSLPAEKPRAWPTACSSGRLPARAVHRAACSVAALRHRRATRQWWQRWWRVVPRAARPACLCASRRACRYASPRPAHVAAAAAAAAAGCCSPRVLLALEPAAPAAPA